MVKTILSVVYFGIDITKIVTDVEVHIERDNCLNVGLATIKTKGPTKIEVKLTDGNYILTNTDDCVVNMIVN